MFAVCFTLLATATTTACKQHAAHVFAALRSCTSARSKALRTDRLQGLERFFCFPAFFLARRR